MENQGGTRGQLSEGRAVSINAGTIIVKENEVSRKMYIIRKGKARVYKTYLNHKVTIAVLGEGEIFGELSFFDAQPRCASVEALSDLNLVEIDGDNSASQMESLPTWVFSILRQVFFRFREMDQKITVLQSMNEYQKKIFKNDNVAKSVYLELLRFVRTFELLFEKHKDGSGSAERDGLYQELNDLLGTRVIGLKVFWRQLKVYDIIDNSLEEVQGKVELHEKTLGGWKEYLNQEIESERYLMLSHSSLAFIRKIIGSANFGQVKTTGQMAELLLDDQAIRAAPFREEALNELTKHKIIVRVDKAITFDPISLLKLYTYQSIIKAFDHTVINVE